MELKNKIALPEGLLKKMHLESVIISPINEQIAIVILSKKEQGGHILRIYRFHLSSEGNLFHLVQELEEFQLGSRKEVATFVDRLPAMSVRNLI